MAAEQRVAERSVVERTWPGAKTMLQMLATCQARGRGNWWERSFDFFQLEVIRSR